ncbi:MAG: translocation/assembly module TamB domain-containing protein [Saprospiraceae bacterium]|nr:translocation/assembly module TamB domain-containing protein [Saprospiraceae bacterium]
MKARKFTKILLGIMLSLFVMYLLVYLLIQLPSVQTYVVKKLTTNLSQSLGTTVSVRKVKLKFFRTASLQDVYFEDINHDTLLYAQEINASLHLFNLFQKKIFFNEISFSNLTANFKREPEDANFNFQFIIDHFSSSEPSTKSPWSLDIQKVRIFGGQLLYDDAKSGQQINSDIGVFTIYLNKFDIAKKHLDIEQIGIGDSYLVLNKEPNQETKDSTSQITFPNTGWTFLVKQIRLDENDLIVHTNGTARQNHLNAQDLDLTNLSVFVDNFLWTQDSLHAEITEATFKDHSGFVLDHFAGQLTATPRNINLENLHIETHHSVINNKTYLAVSSFDKIQYFTDSVYLVANFIESKIDYHDLKLLIPNFNKTPYLNTSSNEIIEISGDLKGTLNNLSFNQLTFNAKNLLSVGLSGKIRQLTEPQSTSFDVSLKYLNTSYDAVKKFTKDISISPGLELWDRFKLSGNLSGNFKNLRGRDFKLNTSSITRFAGDFDIRGINNLQTAMFDVHVNDLRSISDDLQGFVQKDLPASLDSLGQFYYQGYFKGTIRDFAVNGRLSSDAGSMRTDLKIAFDEKYQDAQYNGDLALDSFNLGKVLANESIGHLTMAINVFGSGLNSDVLRATVLGKVEDLVYNDFHYHDLVIDGRFDKKQFAGHASIEDPNIAFNFEGVVNLSDSSSRFRFRADIDTINFNALGFTPNRLGVKGYLESDFNGTFPDNMKGNVLGTKLRFSNLTDHYLIDSFLVLSDFSQQNQRSLQIQSKLLNAKMEGDFTLAGISDFFYEYFNQYFPLQIQQFEQDSILTLEADTIKTSDNPQNFTFDINFINADNLIGLALPKLQNLDTVKLSGWVDSKINYLQITGYSNQIDYDGMSFGPITLSSSGDEKALDHVLSVSNVHIANNIEFPYIQLDISMANDSAYVGLIMEDATDSIQEKLNLSALVTVNQNRYKMMLNNTMVLNGKEWAINPDHKITYAGKFNISDLDLVKDGESLSISTTGKYLAQDGLSAFSFDFKNFQLNEVSQLLEVEDAFYAGSVNGNFTLGNSANKLNYLADLTLNDLTLGRERIGNLVIKSQPRTSDLLDILIRLDGGISGLDIRGTYNRSSSTIDLQGEIDQLEMKNLDPFLSKYITASEGKVSGLIKVGGTSNVPVIDGNFELEKVSTLINYLQARYTFENEDITIIQNKMTFNDFTLLDQNNNSAKINGVADFKSISDPNLNLKFNTTRFLILNTPANSKDFYYGKLYVAADVGVTGQLSHPVLQVNAKALDSTDFVLQPLISQVKIQQEDFIIFANPKSYSTDATVSLQDFFKTNNYNFEISANIECTPDAQLTIVIDPATGDKLVCRGNGNLAINISPDGEPRILGNYIITQGQYAFNFQRVLKRTFIIDSGSRVNFVGDVFQSKFDITASYAVRTSTYELIKNQSTINAAEESRSRQRAEVEVKLKLTGILEQPIAKFDIEIKDQSGSGGVTSAVSSKLSQLREDESGMNKQVFGLLIFSSFIAEEQTTSASLLENASQSAILSSVSNLLSNELNRLARRYIKGVDLDFGVDSYSNNLQEGSGLITELKVGLSKRLLNDRLTIKLGGNVQFENNDNVNLVNNQNSTFSGDFVLEYKLSPEGNYNIKFFQALSNEENLFNPGVNYSETGISLFFTKSFNSKKYQLQLDE